ncbi:hypothetical protein EDD16DRAFT_1681163 [Pisolithus croceorrhizus]|nr:hypothetical protein EDD16DRAFT_1681163 [Pisolithus croceorrhizus]
MLHFSIAVGLFLFFERATHDDGDVISVEKRAVQGTRAQHGHGLFSLTTAGNLNDVRRRKRGVTLSVCTPGYWV